MAIGSKPRTSISTPSTIFDNERPNKLTWRRQWERRDEIGAQGGASLTTTIRSAPARALRAAAPSISKDTPTRCGPSGPPVDATVKWFNEEKGFGFVELGDGSGDAFLHIGVLQSVGHDVVAPETKLRVQVGQGQKGRQVTAVLEVDASGVARGTIKPAFRGVIEARARRSEHCVRSGRHGEVVQRR